MIASRSPWSPVAAFATPELITIACGSACSRWARETTTGAAWTRFFVNIAVPTAGTVVRTSVRSRSCLRIPALTARATKPLAAVTLIPAPRAAAALLSRQAERQVRVLDGLACGALAEVVDRADHDRPAGGAILVECELRGVGAGDPREVGRVVLGQQRDGGRRGVRGLEPLAQVVLGRGRVAGREQAPADGQQVRDEADGEAELLPDLRAVLMGCRPCRARRSRARRRRASSPSATCPRRRRRTSRRRRPRSDRSRRRAARARAARRSHSSRDSRRAGRRAGRARGGRTTSRRDRRPAGARSRTRRDRRSRRGGARPRGRSRRPRPAARATPRARGRDSRR